MKTLAQSIFEANDVAGTFQNPDEWNKFADYFEERMSKLNFIKLAHIRRMKPCPEGINMKAYMRELMFIVINFDPESEWKNKIFENSHYVKFFIDNRTGEVEWHGCGHSDLTAAEKEAKPYYAKIMMSEFMGKMRKFRQPVPSTEADWKKTVDKIEKYLKDAYKKFEAHEKTVAADKAAGLI